MSDSSEPVTYEQLLAAAHELWANPPNPQRVFIVSHDDYETAVSLLGVEADE